jgi:hypothetical protein
MATPPKAKWCRRLVNANFVSRVSSGALASANRMDQTNQAVYGASAGSHRRSSGALDTVGASSSRGNNIRRSGLPKAAGVLGSNPTIQTAPASIYAVAGKKNPADAALLNADVVTTARDRRAPAAGSEQSADQLIARQHGLTHRTTYTGLVATNPSGQTGMAHASP